MTDCHNFFADDSLIACFTLWVQKYFLEIFKISVFSRLVPELLDLPQFISEIPMFSLPASKVWIILRHADKILIPNLIDNFFAFCKAYTRYTYYFYTAKFSLKSENYFLWEIMGQWKKWGINWKIYKKAEILGKISCLMCMTTWRFH